MAIDWRGLDGVLRAGLFVMAALYLVSRFNKWLALGLGIAAIAYVVIMFARSKPSKGDKS